MRLRLYFFLKRIERKLFEVCKPKLNAFKINKFHK